MPLALLLSKSGDSLGIPLDELMTDNQKRKRKITSHVGNIHPL